MKPDQGLAPVIMFVYDRPDHTARTIEALAANALARESRLTVFADKEKGDADRPRVERVRQTLALIADRGEFGSVNIVHAPEHYGLARSVISGVTHVINEWGRVIVLEDDHVTSPDFLSFMNSALERYSYDARIWSISGYSPSIILPPDYGASVYFTFRASSWGYATWKDRWDLVDWSVADYTDFRKSRGARARLNRGGRDMARMLDRQMDGAIDSWAIRWCYAQSKRDALTVYPVQSQVNNIGLDGSGTHSGFASQFSVSLGPGPAKDDLCEPFLDARVLASFKSRYGSLWQDVRMSVGRLVRQLVSRVPYRSHGER